MRAFKGQAARHNHADIARTKDDDLFAGHIAFHVHPALGSASGIDAVRAHAWDANLGAGAFAAAHRQHDRAGFNFNIAVFFAGKEQMALGRYVHHHRVQQHFHVQAHHLFDKVLSVSRTRQVFFQKLQTKPIMDALQQNAAQFRVAFNNQNIIRAGFLGFNRRRNAAWAAANHNNIIDLFR